LDADHAIFDLLAAALPRDAYNAIAWYLATGKWGDYLSALAVLGVDWRDEFGRWCVDVMRELGTWVSWDVGDGPQFGLSPRGRWAPPTKPEPAALRPGLCGRPGHGSMVVDMDPRGPSYPLDSETMVEICASCFCELGDRECALYLFSSACRFILASQANPCKYLLVDANNTYLAANAVSSADAAALRGMIERNTDRAEFSDYAVNVLRAAGANSINKLRVCDESNAARAAGFTPDAAGLNSFLRYRRAANGLQRLNRRGRIVLFAYLVGARVI